MIDQEFSEFEGEHIPKTLRVKAPCISTHEHGWMDGWMDGWRWMEAIGGRELVGEEVKGGLGGRDK